MTFPAHRMRRMRRTEPLRALVRETALEPGDLIYPLFIRPGKAVRDPVSSMPGVFNLSVDEAVREAEEAAQLGLGGLLLFGLPEKKDDQGTGAWEENGIVQQALRALKASPAAKKLVLIADVCLCEYTSHGHCGVVEKSGEHFDIANDLTLDLLARTAVSQARAGADIVAPSDMMDGRVGAIRTALDAAGLAQTPILSYASKFASAFYGPFREAADSAPQFGDRRSYQMDGANLREAMREIDRRHTIRTGACRAEGMAQELTRPEIIATSSPKPVIHPRRFRPRSTPPTRRLFHGDPSESPSSFLLAATPMAR